MRAHLRANLWLLLSTVALGCVLYPAALWVIGQTVFPKQANGSLIAGDDGKPIASRLIAHEVKGEQFFQPRPSACGYNGAASGASNYAASNPALRARVAASLASLSPHNDGSDLADVPAELVMASGSGLDPHITLDGALYQLPRVARAWAKLTGADAVAVQRDLEALLRERAHKLTFGVPLVNVVEMNVELQQRYGRRPHD